VLICLVSLGGMPSIPPMGPNHKQYCGKFGICAIITGM